ncbi:hypothetical protein N9590_04730 [Candidatus Pelagibacter sp.]|nr:hypothetical protein [Candidatus Pelagibacter sp.]
MASEKHGIGHLERSLKLGRNLKKINKIYLCGLNKKYKKSLDKLLFKKIFLLNSYNPTNKSVFKFISSIKPDLCIVDLPKADLNFEKKNDIYKSINKKKLYTDSKKIL